MAAIRQTESLQASPELSIARLWSDALWFLLHTLFAVIFLALLVGAITLTHPDPGSASPKIFATALAFLIPMVGGFFLVRVQPNAQHASVARYVWVSGILLFAIVSVWVLDLPTGPGLCEACGAGEKIWRTLFSVTNGSGLLGEDGLLLGAWAPLSMMGYAVGAAIGFKI